MSQSFKGGVVSCVVLLGLWRSACGLGYTPPDIDFDKIEIFPLSGGVRPGVTVKLTAKGIDAGHEATIAFLTANYEVAFSMEFDISSMKIKRYSSFGSDPKEMFADFWPLSEGQVGNMDVDFHFAPLSWEVTIDGLRSPWLDFIHKTTEPVVYAAVHTALIDGEVVDKRHVCATACHISECSLSSTCSDGSCLRKDYEGSCTSDTETDIGDCTTTEGGSTNCVSCCDGRQQARWSPAQGKEVGDYFQLFSDSGQVSEACTAFGGDGAACAVAAGHKVEIKSIDDIKGVCTVWVPQLYAKAQEDSAVADTIEIPWLVFDDKSMQRSKTLAVSSEIRDQIGRPVGNRGLLTKVTNEGVTTGYDNWWFINMIYITKAGPAQTPAWISYSEPLYSQTVNAGTKLYIVDEDVGHTNCKDDEEWEDKDGNLCSVYTANAWCEDHGVATDAFKNATGQDKLLDQKSPDGWWASWTCCQCGGGFHDAPGNDTALFFQ